MSRLPILLFALVSSGCPHGGALRSEGAGSETRPRPVAVRMRLEPGQRLVYRRGDSLGDPAVRDELHWLERREDGSLVLGVQDDAWVDAGRAEMPADLVFPLPERPVGPETSWAHRTVDLGEMRLAVDEEFRIASAIGGRPLIVFRRRTAVVGEDPAAPEPMTEQRGRASYDPVAGRFVRLEIEETRTEAFGGGSGTAIWVLDEQHPLAGAHAAADGDLDAWIAAHDAASEIAAVVEALADPTAPAPALGLQLEAHPVELWTAVLDHPAAAARFAADPRVASAVGRGLPDEVLALLRARWADAAFVAPLVAQAADERWRPELRQLATGRSAVATDARLTLQALDLSTQPRIDRWRPFVVVPARLQAVWTRLSAREGLDPSPIVPVLLALASAPRVPAAVGDICADVVSAAGLFDASDDRRVWRQWWSTTGADPWPARLVAGARAAAPDQHPAAVAALARAPASDESRAVLAEWLTDPSADVRLGAAWTLARWRDRRAAPALVELLEDPSRAAPALDALGAFCEVTLGFDPAAPAPAALARWRAWLRRPSP